MSRQPCQAAEAVPSVELLPVDRQLPFNNINTDALDNQPERRVQLADGVVIPNVGCRN